MELLPGTIIYFTPFYFPSGNPAKNKYFIALHQDGDDWYVATLPTSKDHVPANIEQQHGCLHLKQAMFSVYIFEKDRPVATNDWAFPRTSYIYTSWVEAFEKRIFTEIYSVEGVDYVIKGRLTREEYEAVLACALGSGDIKARVKRQLQKARYS